MSDARRTHKLYRSNKVFCFQCVMQFGELRHVYSQIKEQKPKKH